MSLHARTSEHPSPDFHTRWLDLSHAVGHFLQHPAWGEFKEAFGWRAVRLALDDGQEFVAGAQVLFRPLPMGVSLAYVPRGPIVRDNDPDLLQHLVRELDALCRRHRAIFLKVEPDWEDAPEWRDLLTGAGFTPSFQTVQPRSTIVVDLSADEETILARMKSKWRYNIRLAARKGVIVRPARESDIPIFLDLLRETAARDGFPIHSADYYRQAWERFAPAGLGTLLMAWYQDIPLAGILVTAWGKTAIYMYGASSNRERHRMPNHLLQWEGMRWAKRQGCLFYDLWGIPDEVGEHPEVWANRTPQRTDGLWGVFRFKQGFGGRIVHLVGAWDRVYSAPLYSTYRLLWRLREKRKSARIKPNMISR